MQTKQLASLDREYKERWFEEAKKYGGETVLVPLKVGRELRAWHGSETRRILGLDKWGFPIRAERGRPPTERGDSKPSSKRSESSMETRPQEQELDTETLELDESPNGGFSPTETRDAPVSVQRSKSQEKAARNHHVIDDWLAYGKKRGDASMTREEIASKNGLQYRRAAQIIKAYEDAQVQ